MFIRILIVLAIFTLQIPVQAKVTPKDNAYFSELELRGQSFAEPQRKLLLSYLQYLQTGNTKDANVYIQALKSIAAKKGEPKLNFSVFEGDIEFCHIENGACTRGLGELTEKYLVPQLKAGDKKALELLFVHTSLIASDGAESENIKSMLKKTKIPTLHKAYFDGLRKSDPLFAQNPNRWM